MHEIFATQKLGANVAPELLERASLPGWTFVPFSPQLDGIAPPLADSMFPGARVKRGVHEVPLALALAPMCTTCDDDAMVTCSICDGRGSKNGVTDPSALHPCPTREPCKKCCGVKFLIRGVRKKTSDCAHPQLVTESEATHFTLSRCRKCSLPALRSDAGLRNFAACAECSRLECVC